MSSETEHTGTVLSANDRETLVKIVRLPACSGCSNRTACTISGQEEKIIRIPNQGETRSPGETVIVLATPSTARQAVSLVYLYPLVLMLAALFITWSITGQEEWAAIAAIGILPLYYLLLYQNKSRFEKKITFKIKP